MDEQELRRTFRAVDKNGDGGITAHELRTIMQKVGINISEKEAREMINSADKGGRGVITENDFVAYVTENKSNVKNDLRQAFLRMDVSRTGFLSPAELHDGLKKIGMNISNREFNEMLQLVDTDHNGQISLEEFINVFE